MKQINRFSILLLAGLVFVFSCAKEQADSRKESASGKESEEALVPAGKTVTISALLADAMTKVDFDPAYADGKTTSLALTWNENDKLIVADHANPASSAEFALVSGAGEKKAVFAGTAPAGATSYDVSVKHGDVTFASQTQPADADASGLQYMASKSGITDLSTIVFDNVNSVLAITAKMPSTEVADSIARVRIIASEAIFNGRDSLTIRLDNLGDAGEDGILHLFATLPQGDQAIAAGTTLLIHFDAPQAKHTVYTRFVELPATTFTAGKLNTINVNASNSASYANASATNIGQSTNPYLIGDAYQVAAINSLATGGQTTYFKMIDDVDMTGVTHAPVNTNSNYTQVVNFDGNNKTISNLSANLFYVFKGSIQNLTLSGSSVGAKRGIFAEYCQGEGHTITNVDIIGGSMAATSNNGGAMIGRINNGSGTTVTITDCDVTNTSVSGAAQTGGLIGSADATIVVSNCTVVKDGEGTSSVNASGSNCGGLIGQTTGNATITDCIVSGTNVTGTGVVGGVVGFANSLVTISNSKYTGGTVTSSGRYIGGFLGSTKDVASRITNCQVEDATINVNHTEDARGGGFVGQLQFSCMVEGCTVGTPLTSVTVNTKQPKRTGSGTEEEPYVYSKINSGGFVGVNYGTITKNGDVRTKAYVRITSNNTYGTPLDLGGFVGFHRGTIEYCDAMVDMSDLQGQYIGGFAGYSVEDGTIARHNTVQGSVKGNNYTGGFVGYVDNHTITFSDNEVLDGTVVNGQSSVGGFAGCTAAGTFSNNTVAGTITVRGNNGGGFVGITNGGSFTDCSSSAAVTGNGTVIGGFVGYGAVANMTRCSASGAVVKNTANGNQVGGFAGSIETCTLDGCNSSGSVTTTGFTSEYVGGFIGNVRPATDALASIQNCFSTGAVNGSGRWTGGFIGYIYRATSDCGNVEISKCYSTSPVAVSGKSYVAGFIGRTYMVTGSHLTIEKSYATGNVTSNQSCASAFIGEIGEATTCSISDCYSTGNIVGSNQIRGGLIAAVNANDATSVTISRCYSTSSLSDGSFRLGGLIGNIAGTNCTMEDCAAWNGAVTATSYSYNKNWSSGTIVGTAHPNCHLTNNFRKPGMTVTMWWAPAADYDHPDVEGTTHPLVIRNNDAPYTYTEATATTLGAPYQFPYHGWHTTQTRLSTLASMAKGASSGQGGLGWSSDVWDFTGELPTLK